MTNDGTIEQVYRGIERGDFEHAQVLWARQLSRATIKRLLFLRVSAELSQLEKDVVNTAETYDDILRITPADRDSLRGRALVVLNRGYHIYEKTELTRT